MSCYSTPTATEFATVTSNSVSTSFSQSVTSVEPIVTTIQLCTVATVGFFPVSSCKDVVSTVDGGRSTVQVPVAVTVTYTQTVPTATRFDTTCSSSDSQSESSTTQSTTASTTPITSTAPSTPSTSEPPGTSSDSPTPPSTPSSVVYTTTLYETSSITLPGGSVIASQFTSVDTVVSTVPAASTASSSGHTGSVETSTSSSPSTTPAIIGAIVGGVAALLILAFVFSCFLRGKKKREEDDKEDDVVYHQLVRKREKREKGIDIDSEARPFNAATPSEPPSRAEDFSVLSRASSSLQHPRPPVTRLHPSSASAPMLRPPIPSSMLSLHDLHSDVIKSQPGSRADGGTSAHTGTPSSTVQDVHDIRRANLHVANRASDGTITPPPLPSKRSSFLSRTHAQPIIAPQNAWPPSTSTAVAGPSTMRMPEPPNQPGFPFVPQDRGQTSPGPSSVPVDKAAEAATDAVQTAELPPPAYSE